MIQRMARTLRAKAWNVGGWVEEENRLIGGR
jgi:hypothetical protein